MSTVFHPQSNGYTEKHNNSIKIYLRTFLNYEQNNKAKLLFMAKFVYMNNKNTSIGKLYF